MILAKARIIEGRNGEFWVGLMFPTGFNPEEVLPETVKANDTIVPGTMRFPPRRGNMNDIYREFEVSFPVGLITECPSSDIRITGRLRRGIGFTASVVKPTPV
jgi:hypothetical protein